MRWMVLLLALLPASSADAQSGAFRKEIGPLLESKCLCCHSGAAPKGDLDLSTEVGLKQGGAVGKVIDSQSPEQSLLLEMVRERKMPPKEPLSAGEIETIRKWIVAGGKWEGPSLQAPAQKMKSTATRAGADWWSLQPIHKPKLPELKDGSWVRNPIDAFILAKLQAHGLQPSGEADRRTYIRRVTFDLIGLPPSPDEIEKFLSDQSPEAYERLVDRLLASPHYGERWGRHWLDVVRFAESHGYETNELRRNAWPYRDWVIRAFNEDKPFSRFVMEQLAGDVAGPGDAQIEVATGFLVGGTHDIVGNQTPEGMAQQRQDDLYDMVSTTGSSFLGLTINCARCHDHKFDPITQRDYYAMQAIFAGVQHSARMLHDPVQKKKLADLEQEAKALEDRLKALEAKTSMIGPARPRLNTETVAPVEARYIRFTVLATAHNDEPCIDELEIYRAGQSAENVALASLGAKASASSAFPDATIHRIEHLNDGKVGNSQSWISNEKGQGWAQIELPQVTKIDRIVWGRDRLMKFKDRLAVKYKIEVSLDGSSWKVVCTQEDRLHRQAPPDLEKSVAAQKELDARKKALEKDAEAIRNRLMVYCGSFKPPEKVHLLKRGDPLQKLEEVAPATIESLGRSLKLENSATDANRRKALAEWIADVRNPLPARVMVNRLWHYHFGCGIVGTPSDFGFNGQRPSHPELLDYLSAEFQANGGRCKPIHRLIVLSQTYRQASVADDATRVRAEKVDAENRLLWRAPRRRLEAEALRDATLMVCGNLDLRMGGPGYDLWDYSNYVVVFKPKHPLPADAYRRMVYQFKPRTQQDATFGAFDCPDATLTMPRRNVSTTALQALNLLNSPFMLDQSKVLADRLRKEAGSTVDAQVIRGFLLALGRSASDKESAQARDVVEKHGLETFCRALLNANEFLFID